jgi:SAM-dependent methyltransferase
MSATLPTVDLDWAINEDIPPGPYPRDSQFVFQRVPRLVAEVATRGRPGRVLDVACGLGGQLALLRRGEWEAWGLDASIALVRHCRQEFAGRGEAPLVCAAAEELPFQSDSFDRIVCQGSLDHFAQPRSFMREVARVLKPNGRAIIGISNFDSLSCRLGAAMSQIKERIGLPVYRGRNYWQIPHNHTFRGTYPVLRRLGEPHLELVECRGISLLWLFRSWTRLTEALPRPLAWSAMTALDRIAFRAPSIADLLVSVWRPRRKTDGEP